jgi:hypothetical protein
MYSSIRGHYLMAKKAKLIGEKELSLALKDLGDNAAKQVMRPSIGKALIPVRRQAKRNITPFKRSGALKKAIWSKSGGKRRSKKAWGKVFIRSKPQQWEGKKINPVKYAGILEFGSSKRGIPATGFLRTAMYFQRAQIRQLLVTHGWINLDKYTAKVRRRRNTMRAARLSA